VREIGQKNPTVARRSNLGMAIPSVSLTCAHTGGEFRQPIPIVCIPLPSVPNQHY
jgi:hypothetical protein